MKNKQFLKFAMLFVAAGFLGGFIAGKVFSSQPAFAQDATIQEEVSAQQLQIMDKNDNLRLLLSTDKDNGTPSMAFYDEKGTPRSVFAMTQAGETLITLNDANGKLRVAFGVTEEGGSEILMDDESGNKVWGAP